MEITQTKFDIGIGYVDPKKKSDFYFPPRVLTTVLTRRMQLNLRNRVNCFSAVLQYQCLCWLLYHPKRRCTCSQVLI